ncbi:hypothetical protein VHEMI02591 [[Torrubiella] hemipterigena]|uniref:Tat pathway signal sequence n=1 Tax=[Torrubiella] hemipterigena TaxID=1531966 RepID=A0A0A1T8C9_9HYPO|nr:hypothetical protein VHEMI02591 [[Torrubiella] hemipterigena]
MKYSLVAALGAAAILVPAVSGQVISYSAGTTDLTFLTGTKTDAPGKGTSVPSSAYPNYTSQITLGGNKTASTISGSLFPSSPTGANATATSSQAPKNTQPCNQYVEFCKRKYSNITMVGCHNSPFVRPGNVASNQELPVKLQLNDGVRFLQGQIQWPTNGTVPHFCHTSCDLLDAGPIYQWLGEVKNWVDAHPYDVVTILLGNGNYSDPSLYVPFIEQSGILKYTYEAPLLPMRLNDWPTLEELILTGKRVIMFMDYNADQKKYPWLLDEFSQMWETPFDPTDRKFPCTVQRPPDLKPEDAKNRMYLMNHNLNVEFNVFNLQLLAPAVAVLNETNAFNGTGSAGLAANNCRSDWGRAPNIINVDYYNYGTPNGSVFEAAARVNNVTYKWDCCGKLSAGTIAGVPVAWLSFAAMFTASYLLL